ncbi:hypothetical protein CHS0354_010626 [Potamilus streckersoni]|uniref:Alpha-N-acetylglucosaminidase n=1 Tax=Potamilus streckersoni TaxID=2493646 RepID=A0AAE0SFY6_9BIVA|nr:hypothetical protein CHS0354_010626 [Potamilus streckersoni]
MELKLLILSYLLLLSEVLVLARQDFIALKDLKAKTSLHDQRQAVQDLIGRVLGKQDKSFHVVLEPGPGPAGRDTFNLLSDGNEVTITATSGIAAAMGFYYYLKNYCNCQYTWAGAQLNLPDPLPVISSPGKTVTAMDRFRYYQNVCTVSYSFVWWTWKRWEREIDWMAMNGINLPLAFTGQEAIFQRVYMKLGFTKEDLEAHFGGAAFLAWARMGNMEGWGGPLAQTWIDAQLILQHQILTRMRSLGMIPVVPGFAGHVPKAINRLYPTANYTVNGDWLGFPKNYCCTYQLEFNDPLFQKIGTMFIQEMKAEYGVDHVYNADSFNELIPRSSDPDYIRSSGKAIYNAMVQADPQAIWLMQGWLFQSPFWKPPQIEALLTSVPQGKMIVLDLFAEVLPVYNKTNSFYGQPFIWCMLHNFGGTMEFYGDVESINREPFNARIFPNSSMVGIGLTPEGINQNEVVYELMNENAWATEPWNLTEWISHFALSRYGTSDDNIDMAWQLLKRSVYNNSGIFKDHSRDVIPTTRPRLYPPISQEIWYNTSDLYQAWEHLVQATANTSLKNNTLFRYDLVDVTRNSLQILSILYYVEIAAAFTRNDSAKLQEGGDKLLKLLDDLDKLLGSDPHFLLGSWIADARQWGKDDAEQDLLEYNARNQITLWGPNGEIRDYAAKQWSGLIAGYYKPRWELFISSLTACLSQGVKFNQTQYDIDTFLKVEQPFTLSKTKYPSQPVGDSVTLVLDIYKRYFPDTHSEFFHHLQQFSLMRKKEFMKQTKKLITEIRSAKSWFFSYDVMKQFMAL